ncbi:MAG TPA: hypothetical protein VG225_00325 [Terracidiphilus sp.]|jgi:hypothetical protein|nr:hypothetical protein [Terracidiphilus sp.]
MAAAIDIARAQSSLQDDAEASRVFQFILNRSAAPGWMIVKELGQEPETTESSLIKLRGLGLLEANGDGLDGFYHSTSLGYALKEVGQL